jgi:hypothetical protein
VAKRKPRIGECTYCGNVTVLTSEHVVPRALFVPPYPSHPVVVPVCQSCNVAKSRHDDYLRDFLALDYRSSQSSIAQTLFSRKVWRSISRNSSELVRTAVQAVDLAPLYTRGGIYLGDYPKASVDDTRLSSVLSLMVRGLYYDARKQRLPNDYAVTVLRHDPWDYQAIYKAFNLSSRPATRMLGEVFACALRWATEDPCITIWLLLFYNRVLFSAFSKPTRVCS